MALSKILPASQEQFAGARNLIINGACTISQRGTSFSQSPNSGGYHTVDRFSYRRTGTWSGVTAVTLTQESSGAPEGFKNFLRYAPVGSDATTPSGATMKAQYKVEGLDAAHLAWGTSNAKAVTVSFYIRSSVTGTFNVFIGDDDASSTRTLQVKEYTINSADTWERKSLTFSAPTSGNWPIDNGKFLELNWIISGDNTGGGSIIVTSPDSWTVPVTDTPITSNQTDGVTTSSGQTWDITGIQLEVGEQATPFEHRSYADELRRCQRYFCNSNTTASATAAVGVGIGHAENTTRMDSVWIFPVQMRSSPTLTHNSNYIIRTNANQTISTTTFGHPNIINVILYATGSFTDKEGSRWYQSTSTIPFTADAEL